jgi:hypothetical protein
MRLFSRRYFNDLIFLMPIQLANEQLPDDKIRMLYCDSKGQIITTIIENAAYELAQRKAEELRRANKNYAILDIETAPGTLVPLAVAISSEQVSALNLVLDHAIRRGVIPDILKRYTREIIGIGGMKREELKEEYERARTHVYSGETPEALQKLTYFPGGYMQVVAPIYKSEYHYPLVVIKGLAQDKDTPPNIRRLLTLDGDGDFLIIGIRREMIDEFEEKLEEWKRANNIDGCIIILRDQGNFIISYMEISELQRKALNSVEQKFEETKHLQKSIASDAITVISRAKDYFRPGDKTASQ